MGQKGSILAFKGGKASQGISRRSRPTRYGNADRVQKLSCAALTCKGEGGRQREKRGSDKKALTKDRQKSAKAIKD